MADQDVARVVDDRIALLRPGLELDLRKELERLVAERNEATRKTLTWGLGAATVLLALLGITTISDIKKMARDAAIAEVKGKLSLDDPNSQLRREIDQVVARSLIDSWLLRIAGESTAKARSRAFAELVLPDRDAERIFAFIASERTSGADFRDGLDVLRYFRQAHPAYEAKLDDLLFARAPYEWIEQAPEKQALILEQSNNARALEFAHSILDKARAHPALLGAAVGYAGRFGDARTAPLVEPLVDHSTPEVAEAAQMAIGSLNPASPIVRREIDVAADGLDPPGASRLLRVAAGLARRGPVPGESHFDLRTRLITAAFSRVIRAGYIFTSGGTYYSVTDGGVVPESPKISRRDDIIGEPVPLELFGAFSRPAMAPLLAAAAATSPRQFHRTAAALCLQLDDGVTCNGVISMEFGRGSALALAGGRRLDATNSGSGVTIEVQGEAGSEPLVAIWSEEGRRQRAEIVSFVNGGAAKFALHLPDRRQPDQ